MEEKLKAAKEILRKYDQEQLLVKFDELSEDNKIKLLDQILTLDFGDVEKLYENTKIVKDFKKDKIEPIDYVDKEKLKEEETNEYTILGKKEIIEGKLAVVTMAGGQGTRLGHNGPKGTFMVNITPQQSIFEILCNKLKKAKEEYNVYIPWYIMTSKDNNEQTISFFEENQYFGYPKSNIMFFVQGELPMLDTEGKILVNETGLIKEAANGHGGIFATMLDNGVNYDMKTRGIKWIFISGVDNILANYVDPLFIGLAENKKVLAAGKSVVKRSPDEKVGVFCKKNGKPSVIEYTEISESLANQRKENGELLYGESHILCNLFNIEAIERLSKDKLPYHTAFKKATYIDKEGKLVVGDKPNAYKFESFLFDAFELLDDIAILRVKREDEFSPIKNANGEDSPETAKKLYEEWIKRNSK